MPAARLNESQKAELVQRFRAGEGLQGLAESYGCSANTVSRVVKAALPEAEYGRLRDARLKEQRNARRASEGAEAPSPQLDLLAAAAQATAAANAAAATSAAHAEAAVAQVPEQTESAISTPPPPPVLRQPTGNPAPALPASEPSSSERSASELAIADADDFGDPDDEGDEDTVDPTDPDDPHEEGEGDEAMAFIPLPLLEVVDDHTEIRPRPLQASDLSGSAWMLVDKAVELQARPLSEFTDLGRLPAEELERQALLVFVNPRQAKRQCGRTQRVIKIPDSAVLARTAPYLLAQGISRLVIEGALFALPGS